MGVEGARPESLWAGEGDLVVVPEMGVQDGCEVRPPLPDVRVSELQHRPLRLRESPGVHVVRPRRLHDLCARMDRVDEVSVAGTENVLGRLDVGVEGLEQEHVAYRDPGRQGHQPEGREEAAQLVPAPAAHRGHAHGLQLPHQALHPPGREGLVEHLVDLYDEGQGHGVEHELARRDRVAQVGHADGQEEARNRQARDDDGDEDEEEADDADLLEHHFVAAMNEERPPSEPQRQGAREVHRVHHLAPGSPVRPSRSRCRR
mmetsp:Transcript_133345/g.414647  ORF Transcript_133345/g.414647 Transcript_133345/m.414647 type:complete len:260 (+) Transcript_133345:790-1569(+)